MANANIAFSKETLQRLAELSELNRQPTQELQKGYLDKQ